MIEQTAKVVACHDDTLFLETQRQSTCGGCKLKQGCGTGLLDKHVGNRFSQLTVDSHDHDVELGQNVTVAVEEEVLLRGALLMYIVPLILLFTFSAVSNLFQMSEAIEIIAGLSGFLLGLYLVKLRINKQKALYQVHIIEE